MGFPQKGNCNRIERMEGMSRTIRKGKKQNRSLWATQGHLDHSPSSKSKNDIAFTRLERTYTPSSFICHVQLVHVYRVMSSSFMPQVVLRRSTLNFTIRPATNDASTFCSFHTTPHTHFFIGYELPQHQRPTFMTRQWVIELPRYFINLR